MEEYIELKSVRKDGTEITIKLDANSTLNDLVWELKHFTLALGYSSKTVEEYFNID